MNSEWQKKFTLQRTYMQGKDFCEEFTANVFSRFVA
jgi:hypothetical protein